MKTPIFEITITHPDVPVIGGCIYCKKSIRSRWFGQEDVIADPTCDECYDRMCDAYEATLNE